MTGTTAQPSGQAPSQPASTAQGGTASTPDSTLLGADPAASTAQNNNGSNAGDKNTADKSSAAGDDGKGGDKGGDAKAGEKAGEAKAPEKYEFQFPEGTVVDQGMLDGVSPVLRELNLSQEQAQKLIDVYAGRIAQQNADFAKQLEKPEFALEQAGAMLAVHREKWADAIKNDGELGGKNFDGNVQTMQKALARFGSPELKQLLNATGLGNHPELARFCLKVGQAISEDNPSTAGAGGAGGRKPTEDVFYGGAQSA